jgi:hypothetical protein
LAVSAVPALVLSADIVMLAANDSGSVPGGALWLVPYLLGSPLVHFAHDRIGVGVASFALSAGVPFAAFTIGFSAALFQSGCDNGLPRASGPPCGANLVLPAILVTGLVLPPLLDAAFLAWERQPASPASRASRLTWQPFLAPGEGRTLLAGVAGQLP